MSRRIHMRKMWILAMSLLTLAVIAAGAVADEATGGKAEDVTVETVLDRYIEAIGGREAVEKLNSATITGKAITDFTASEKPIYQSLYLTASAKAPMNCRIEIISDGDTRLEGYDGEKGWVKDRCGVRPDEEAGRGKLAFLINPQGALHVQEYFPNLSYAGVTDFEGKKVHALKPASLKEAHYTLYFCVESHMLVAIGYYWTIGDYRDVSGVLLPHRISASRKMGSVVYELETITPNVNIDNSLFALPDSAD